MKGKILGVLILGLVLAGCSAQATETKASAAKGEKVVVGTGNAYPPFVYLDENNELTGYDVAVLKEVDNRLPDYYFEYEAMDFKTILTALSSNHVQLAQPINMLKMKNVKRSIFMQTRDIPILRCISLKIRSILQIVKHSMT